MNRKGREVFTESTAPGSVFCLEVSRTF